jgi:Icc-related predicted phosphoesterase
MGIFLSYYIPAIYAQIPLDTEILLTHTPPYLILDETRRGKHAGCEELAGSLKRLDACRLHVFGHIHEAHGTQIESRQGCQRISVNAAMKGGSQAIIVDLKN